MRFHHIGIASDFREKVPTLARILEREPSNYFVDVAQGVSGCFFDLPNSNGFLEFLEELPGSNVLNPWKSRGVSFYHIGFEVDNLEISLQRAKNFGAILVSPPKNAAAFPGRSVAFLFVDGVLIEYIGS